MDVKFYVCNHCGNVAIKPWDVGVPLVCCGEKMTELVPNSSGAAEEKHMPVAAVEGNTVTVKVGEVAHPMGEDHLIAFVVLVTEAGYQVAQLDATSEPQATFAVAEGDTPVKVCEYCNKHGLWCATL